MIEPQALTVMEDWTAFANQEAVGLFQTLRDPEKGWPFMRDNSVFIEGMTQTVINRTLTPEEHDRFREPFTEWETRKPMWVFPNQLPIEGRPREVVNAVEARNGWLMRTPMPKLLVYAAPGCNIREPQLAWCRENLPNLTLHDIGKGFHYLPEENPHSIGAELQRWLREIAAAES